METKFNESNISGKDTDTVNTKYCLYCNKPFTEEILCKECINSLEKLTENGLSNAMVNLAFYWYQKAAENGNKKAMFNLATYYEMEMEQKRI
jgi:hypothetical protein